MSSSFDFYFPSVFSSKELSFEEEVYQQRFKKCFSSPVSFFSDKVLDNVTEKTIVSNCLENIISDNVDKYDIEIFIEDRYISKIIGRRGENINKVRSECKVFVRIFDKNEESTTHKVKIVGTKQDVIIAKERITKYVL
jgi:predicted PilT family ATPase